MDRHGRRLLLGIAAVAYSPVVAPRFWGSLALDAYFDTGEPIIPAVAWIFRHGEPLYHSLDAAVRYSHINLTCGVPGAGRVACDLWPEHRSVKTARGALVGLLGGLALLFWACRRISSSTVVFILTGVAALICLQFRNSHVLDPTRAADDFLFRLLWSRRRAPVKWRARNSCRDGQRSAAGQPEGQRGVRRAAVVPQCFSSTDGVASTRNLLSCCIRRLSMAPFPIPGISLQNYLDWLRVSGHNGSTIWSLRLNTEWATFPSLPAALWVYRTDRRERSERRRDRKPRWPSAPPASGSSARSRAPGSTISRRWRPRCCSSPRRPLRRHSRGLPCLSRPDCRDHRFSVRAYLHRGRPATGLPAHHGRAARRACGRGPPTLHGGKPRTEDWDRERRSGAPVRWTGPGWSFRAIRTRRSGRRGGRATLRPASSPDGTVDLVRILRAGCLAHCTGRGTFRNGQRLLPCSAQRACSTTGSSRRSGRCTRARAQQSISTYGGAGSTEADRRDDLDALADGARIRPRPSVVADRHVLPAQAAVANSRTASGSCRHHPPGRALSWNAAAARVLAHHGTRLCRRVVVALASPAYARAALAAGYSTPPEHFRKDAARWDRDSSAWRWSWGASPLGIGSFHSRSGGAILNVISR